MNLNNTITMVNLLLLNT